MASRLTTFIVVLIVTGTVIAGLIVGAQRDDEAGRVDLIVTNGRVFTGAHDEFAEALAIQGNKILQVGSNREIKRLRRAQTLMVDAHGASILPGFVDAHVHLPEAARARAGVDLTDAVTLDVLGTRVREFADAHPDAEWIRGRGWSYALFPDSLPTRQVLDDVVPDRPAYLVADDGRTAWANSRALVAAGITRHTANPRGGLIVRDPRTGEPTGALRDAAQQLVERALPDPTVTEQLEGLQAAIQDAHSAGVTSVHSIGDSIEDLELYDALRSTGALQLRVYAALGVSSTDDEEVTRVDAAQERYPDDPLLKTGAVVLKAAGGDAPLAFAVNDRARTATDLAALVAFFDARGWQTLVEAEEPQDAEAALDAFQSAGREAAMAPRRRHRLDRPAPIAGELTDRLVSLGVAAGVLPHGDAEPAAWRVILDAGGRVAFGSDWPATFEGAGARLAHVLGGDESDADATEPADDARTLAQAIEAWTAGAAWTSFDEQRKGRIARGMLADIIILNTDIFRPGFDLSGAVVEKTIFDGKIVYTRAAAPIGTH